MTGKGHRWTGIGAAFLAASLAHVVKAPEIFAATLAAVSTTIPDWSEIPFYRNGERVGSLIAHRTITHWPLPWLGLGAWGAYEGQLVGACALGTAVGALVHILGDAPNPMGIPWLLPNRRLRIGRKGWWRSGEYELFIALFFAISGFALWRVAG